MTTLHNPYASVVTAATPHSNESILAARTAQVAQVGFTDWRSDAPTVAPPPHSIEATLTERGKRYGAFKDHANLTQQLKATIFGFNPKLRLENDQKEALEMIAHKIGRIVNGDPNYADSWVDIAGYSKLVADRLEGVVR